MIRLSDGKSMCLGEHDVGVKVWWDWPGYDHGYGEAERDLIVHPPDRKGRL